MKTQKLTALIASFSLISLVLLTGTASANTNKLYQLKGDAPTGTLIRSVEAVSPISFTKRFAKLNEREQKLFKAKYDELGLNDTPPFPRSGLRSIYRPIVNANKKINATGSLHLSATVNANGFVESVSVLNSPDVELTAAAEEILLSTRFDAASCNGAACEMTFPFEITFE